MRLGMIQSNYIPWRGYFDFIASVDVFVFYDDVAYGRGKKWRNRNKIKTREGSQWLTVPLEAHDSSDEIRNVRISYGANWVARHMALIHQNYRNAPFYDAYSESFFDILRSKCETISMLNIILCRWLCGELGITTIIRESADIGIAGDKYHRPVDIASAMRATTFLTGPNTLAYTDPHLFASRGIGLEVKTYDYPPYPQQWGAFIGNVSVLDLLLNVGPQARGYIRSASPNIVLGSKQ